MSKKTENGERAAKMQETNMCFLGISVRACMSHSAKACYRFVFSCERHSRYLQPYKLLDKDNHK